MRDFSADFTIADEMIAVSRFCQFEAFKASDGRKSDFKHLVTAPLISNVTAFQVGLAITGRLVGFVQTILKEAEGLSLKSLHENIHERSAYNE